MKTTTISPEEFLRGGVKKYHSVELKKYYRLKTNITEATITHMCNKVKKDLLIQKEDIDDLFLRNIIIATLNNLQFSMELKEE